MKVRTLGLTLVFAMLVAATSFAGNVTITLDPNSGDYVFYQFYDQFNNLQQQFVAPYPVTVQSAGLIGGAALACYDINNPNWLGGSYTGTVYYSTTTAEKEISWLGDHVRVATDPQVLGALSNAMWELGFPSSTNAEGGYLPIDPAAAPWIADAQAAVLGGYQPNIYIFVPDDASTQRFGFIHSDIPLYPIMPPSPTPEPASMLLVGTGVLGIAGAIRRKMV
jgi:PEP-CTERM motif